MREEKTGDRQQPLRASTAPNQADTEGVSEDYKLSVIHAGA